MYNEKGKIILLVEDEAIIALAEAYTIREFGYEVITVHSGEKAVELALSNENINLILMDINLGHGIDGPTAAERILEKRNVPIIFHTSHTEQSYVDRVRKITRYGYVLKNSGNFVLRTSIEMAFELFNTTRKLEKSIDLLKINENLLNEAQQLAHIGHWHWDIIEKKLTWSEEIFAIFGVDRNSFVVSAENFEQLIHPDDRELFLKKRQFMLEHELQIEIEHRIVRPDAKIRYVVERAKVIRDKFGKVIYVIGNVQDITEQKMTEIKINERNLFVESLINLNFDIVYIYDIIEKINIYSNDGIQRVLGYTPDELKIMGNRLISELMHPADFDLYMKKITPRYEQATDNEIITHTYRMKHKNGEWRWLESNERIYRRLPDNKPQQIFGVIHDITGQVITAENLQHQLSENETILTEIQHRIKNNIALIESLLTLQTQSIAAPEAVSALKDAISRIKSIRILYEKLQFTHDFNTISAKYYFEDIINSIVIFFPSTSKITIDRRIEDIAVDSKKLFYLGIIVNELFTNIMKYAFTGRNTGLIQCELIKRDNTVKMLIADNGNGLPADFDINESRGFGLMLVKMLARQLRGSFLIESQNGTRSLLEFDI